MAWNQTDAMDERLRFVFDHKSGLYTHTELCLRFNVSRKTGYKILDRYAAEGPLGLIDRSRAPRSGTHWTDEEIVNEVLELRRRHPTWGPKKIRALMLQSKKQRVVPAMSTIGDILLRHGAIQKRKRNPARDGVSPRRSGLLIEAPNDEWSIDFKGQFRLGNRQYCFPLTVCDSYSRMLLTCQALSRPTLELTQPNLKRLFVRYGLPRSIRSDNGAPFGNRGPQQLSSLGVWLIKLGIVRVMIRPGCPQDNGRHERMHRTLKCEATRPPAFDFPGQQRRFYRFTREYNTVRPHEALGQVPPTGLYVPSDRRLPKHLTEPEYPGHFEIRRPARGGCISFKGHNLFISEALAGEVVGLEEIDDGIWNVKFFDLDIVRFDERRAKLKSR